MPRFSEDYYAGALSRLGIDNINARRAAAAGPTGKTAALSRGVMMAALLVREIDRGVIDSDHLILEYLLAYDAPTAANATLVAGAAYVQPDAP